MPLYRGMGPEGTEMNGEEKNGGGAGTRTPDTGIMIPLLYQLSYTAPGKFQRLTILYRAFFVKKNDGA